MVIKGELARATIPRIGEGILFAAQPVSFTSIKPICPSDASLNSDAQ